MATNTTNFNLVKPAQDDFYDIDVQNGNMDIIDAELKKSKDHIANTSNPHNVTKTQVGLGNVPNVATNDQTPTYTAASANTALTSGEKLSVAMGKIAKAVSSLISHLANTSNPHSVTKSQVGLGSVPNVATNDQTPTYSDTTTLATLASGEKLSVAFPKIKLAITNLINHLANKSNPHAVTKSQLGLGNVENKSSATIRSEITSSNVTTALGYTPPKQDTVYTLPTANASTKGGVKLSDSVSSTSAASSGIAATPKAVKTVYDIADAALPKAGGTMSGTLTMKKVENGYAYLHKNHDASNDYGTQMTDHAADGSWFRLYLSALNKRASVRDSVNDVSYELFHQGNKDLLRSEFSFNMKTFTSLEDIGLTTGSETIATIAANLPNNSMLIFTVAASNASIYPTNYGLVTVKRTSSARIEFTMVTTAGVLYTGFYTIVSAGDTWTGWIKALKADGDTMTGDLTINNSSGVNMKNTSGTAMRVMHINSNNDFVLGSSLRENVAGNSTLYAGNSVYLYVPSTDGVSTFGVKTARVDGDSNCNSSFVPASSSKGKMYLGMSNAKWYSIYATTASVQTSDAREKENIIPFGTSPIATFGLRDTGEEQLDIHSELFDRLQPVQFNFIDGNGRICYGLVAQDVAAAMEELGIGENELDLVHHDFWTDEDTGEEKESYGLAYNNIIAMLIHEVQKLKTEVNTLKENQTT